MENKTYTVEQITSLINNLLNNVKNKDDNKKNSKVEEDYKKNITNKNNKDGKKKKVSDINPTLNKKNNEEEISKALGNQIINDSDDDNNKEEDTDEKNYSGILYKYKDENHNIYYYQFHRKIGDKIDLRCKDRKCHGTASVNQNDIITIKTKCDLQYTNHNYIKEINAYNLIKNDEVNEDNMKEEIPL